MSTTALPVELRAIEKLREVGGDFLDYFELTDGCVGLYLGDVSGKGLPAAMYAALAVGTPRGAHKMGLSASGVLTTLTGYPMHSTPQARASGLNGYRRFVRPSFIDHRKNSWDSYFQRWNASPTAERSTTTWQRRFFICSGRESLHSAAVRTRELWWEVSGVPDDALRSFPTGPESSIGYPCRIASG